MYKILIGLIVVSLTLTSCSNHSTVDVALKGSRNKYFDLKNYLEKEMQTLSTYSSFSKTVSINGEEEEKQLKSVDFENDLKVFINSDINRPAWSDKYVIDSTYNQNRVLTNITYSTANAKLPTKLISIDFDNEKVLKIRIENRTETAIATNKQILTYEPAKGYSIESFQDVANLDAKNFKVKVEIQ